MTRSADRPGVDQACAVTVQGVSPRTGLPVGGPTPVTDGAALDRVCGAAAAAATRFAEQLLRQRADALRAVAAALRAHEDELVGLADEETALGPARLSGELVRTRRQLELFATVVEEGSVFEPIIDLPDPDALPAPRPDLRRILAPLGPVAVFAASNFPFAFSVAGGDTASALAAGCPVIVKAHSAQPALSVRCGQIVRDALRAAGAPDGVFDVVHGTDTGRALVRHRTITAAGFTGSLAGGRALFDLAVSRPDPIPFYGELGSLNPVVVTPGAVAERADAIVAGFVASYTLGTGQFCTKPGLLFLPAGHGLDAALRAAVAAATVGPLLTERIRAAYDETSARFATAAGVRPIVPTQPADGPGHPVHPALFRVPAAGLSDPLLEECFGPAALVVEYDSAEELLTALDRLPGSLTAGLHATAEESGQAAAIVARFARRAGRVVYGGWPTGVAVTWAMQHGGPWPATTAPLHTSVGVTAIRRWQRPVAYQDVPDALLPLALRDANPLRLLRRVNGRITSEPI